MARERFDVLVTDLKMRKPDGLEVMRFAKRQWPGIKVIIITGFATVETATAAIVAELTRLREEPVPEAELLKAKEMVKGRLVLRMEDTRSVSAWVASQELLLGRIMTVDEVIAIVEAITPQDLLRVAGELFSSDGLSLALVGPGIDEDRLWGLLRPVSYTHLTLPTN